MILEIENLNFSINNRKILHNVSLNIGEGKSLCIFGKNGAGKSSLLKCIAGINYFDEGEIKLVGNEQTNRKQYFSDLGCFFNEDGLYSYLTLKENYIIFLSYYDIKRNEIDHLITEYVSLFELEEILNKKIKHLSSGQKQRASLALTFMHKPKLLLFDEPLNNLDSYFIDKFYSFTKHFIEINKAGLIIINHDVLSTPKWIDQIAVIDQAKLYIRENNQESLDFSHSLIVQK